MAKMITTRTRIRVTEIPSIVSSARVTRRTSPYAKRAISAAATSAMTIQSAPFQIPEPWKKSTPNRPASAVDAAVNAR